MSDPAVLAVAPARLRLVEISRSMSLRQLQELQPSVSDLERLADLNRVEVDEALAAGSLVKRGVGERPWPDERR